MDILKQIKFGLIVTFSFIILGGMVVFYSYVNPTLKPVAQVNTPLKTDNKPATDLLSASSTDPVVDLRPKNFEQLLSTFKLINTPTPINNLGAVGLLDLDLNKTWSSGELVALTNGFRTESGLAVLAENNTLTSVARARVEDMFAKNYFAHSSPSGDGVEEVATKTGYGYIALGENLALGEFDNYSEIIKAWQNSPAHRDNMLAKRYSEIGVFIKSGIFNDRKVVIAVQVFGAPVTKCFLPDPRLKTKILSNKAKLDSLDTPLKQLGRVIDNPGATSFVARQRNILEYNSLAKEFNFLIDSTQKLITDYNSAVVKFNSCAKTIVN